MSIYMIQPLCCTTSICISTYTWSEVRVLLYLPIFSMITYDISYLWYVQYVEISFYELMTSRITHYMFFISIDSTGILLEYLSRQFLSACTSIYDQYMPDIYIYMYTKQELINQFHLRTAHNSRFDDNFIKSLVYSSV